MTEYSEHRRPPPVPRLNRVTRNEAAEDSDLERVATYERARESIADDVRQQKRAAGTGFAEVLKKKGPKK
jgi:hypothetical protein